jgi:MFS family permease
MLLGLVMFKSVLHLSDTLLITAAIFSMGLCTLVIGLARSSWLIYASLAPGALHGLLNPLTYTFISCLVTSDQVGKTYAINSIASKLAGIAQNAILQSIYTATVDWYQVHANAVAAHRDEQVTANCHCRVSCGS